jgi:hypothetical protein
MALSQKNKSIASNAHNRHARLIAYKKAAAQKQVVLRHK